MNGPAVSAASARGRSVLAVVALVCLLAGCGSSGPAASADTTVQGTVNVFAAASLTGAFTTLGQRFEAAHPGTKVVLNFGPSSSLATQIDQGAPADVFASASTTNMDQVVKAGRASRPTTFAKNVMEVAVPTSNPAGVHTLEDLAGPDVKVAVCQPEVPCGVLAHTVFSKAGLHVKPVSLETDVKSVLTKVELGEVDAGLVYVTDVLAAGGKARGIPIPSAVNASTDYPIATLAASENAVTAKAFTDFVLSSEGLAVLTADGFTEP